MGQQENPAIRRWERRCCLTIWERALAEWDAQLTALN